MVCILGFTAAFIALITWSLSKRRLTHISKEIYVLHVMLLGLYPQLVKVNVCPAGARAYGMSWKTVALCFAEACPRGTPGRASKLPEPASKLLIRQNCKVNLDRRKKKLPNAKDQVNTALCPCVCPRADAHMHVTRTHTPHVFYQCSQ